MNAAVRQCRRSAWARVAAALAMLGLWLGLNLLAASPIFHRLVHGNTDPSSHDCVLSLISKGLVTASETFDSKVVPPGSESWVPGDRPTAIRGSSDIRLVPGRAPPTLVVPEDPLC